MLKFDFLFSVICFFFDFFEVVGCFDKEDDVEVDGLDVDEVDDVVLGVNVIDFIFFDVFVVFRFIFL